MDSLDIENYKLQVEGLEKEVNHLNEIITNGGRVMAPCKGTISKMELQQGKFTIGQEAVAISFERCSLKGTISKEDVKHITIGDEINIKINSKKEMIKATIESVGVPNSEEIVDVIAIMPEGNYLIGTEVSFEIKKNSSDKYDKCISIQGLRSDEKSKYVLVLREKDTPLGKVSVAARCDIEVVDKSYLNAAISGSLSKEDKVIVSSSRNIEEGDKVRVESDEEVH